MRPLNPRRAGSALVIILPIIAILALIILTVLSIALFDSRFASNSFEQARAGSMVKYAIDDVADKLYQIPLDRHWASGPGRIRYWDGVSSWGTIDLHSGVPAATPAVSDYLDGVTAATAAKDVQLNVLLPDGSYTIMSTNSEYPTAPDMTIKWIYVLQDGTIQTDPTKLPNQGVIGRYGYWTDVENGRVNINTAGFGMVNGPPNPASATNPTGRFQWAVENWPNVFTNTAPAITITLADYAAHVFTPNPWISDRMQTSSTEVSFPALDRPTAQANTIQNLTAHPSSIDLSLLDNVSVLQSFNTFRYAGSYFLRVDARNSYSYFTPGTSGVATDETFSPTPNPDLSVRFFNDPSDWKLIVDPATYQRNKGYITVRGRSPEINPWGLPKIALSETSKDGSALNDLTEYYYRTVNPGGYGPLTTQDSRLTQVPSIFPPPATGNTPQTPPPYVVPPWSMVAGRSSFRDVASSPPYINNVLFVAALMNDLKTTLNTSIPGFSTSLGAKYNAEGSSGGETEQIAAEMLSFVDGCINDTSPGYAPLNTQLGQHALSLYGLILPMASAPTEAASTRRQGTIGQCLVNEIALQAQSVTYKTAAASLYALTPPAPLSVATTLPTPKAILTELPGALSLLFLLRQPLDDNTPPDGKSTDKFIKVILRAEIITPPHFGFALPLKSIMNPTGNIANTVIQWSTDDTNWNTLSYDLFGDQKVNGVYTLNPDTPPVYLSDNPAIFKPTLNNNQHLGVSGAVSVFKSAPFPTIQAGGDSYAEMTENTSIAIYIGPFAPGTVVSLKIKPRVIFYDGTLLEVVPGIFPDFPSGDTGDSSYIVNRTNGNADLNDPNDPSIASNWLEFDFPDFNVDSDTDSSSLVPAPCVSYEATDPRVTRHKADWKLSTNPFGHTLGEMNSMYTPASPPPDSDLARPPSFLQTIRGPMRSQALTPGVAVQPEIQTASRILGLPGVGYFSSLPTGVDSGIPWSTMKFYSNADNPPDWLLWNLFYVPFDRSMSNQTDGKLNINAKLYPFKDASGNDLVREKPLEALLGNRVSNPTALATAIAAGPAYTNGGALPSDLYVYTGQICQVPGLADGSAGSNEYDQERLPRDLADIVTTQSCDFRVFVVAQTLKQSSTGQITPVTTQRVEATLSRIVDAGNAGYAFAMGDSAPFPFNVYLRSSYRPTAGGAPVPSAARVDVEANARHRTVPLTFSPLGADHIPNTADDWLIPQKIEISSCKVIK